ncbi:hypothetical protein [Nocardioides pinisoli]|uniref:Tyr recombinase domain-containing protein n=1 Tax=Nocardioides pinisoli TaxID=2950279 RepID=A0ABT1L2Z9_9ACTN|nr:hypothetical protein [Nocardioides pinisoli]MCP3423851.1 hypothetical protein [Nocardioides pinisoli]
MPEIIDLLLATGCRIGEVLALRWTDIDLSATPPTVSISGTIKTETGKGTFRKAKPESDASKRTIALPPFAVAVRRARQTEAKPVMRQSFRDMNVARGDSARNASSP